MLKWKFAHLGAGGYGQSKCGLEEYEEEDYHERGRRGPFFSFLLQVKKDFGFVDVVDGGYGWGLG